MTRAEQLGYDSLWTPDHVLPTPPTADPTGRILEPYMCLSAVAGSTSTATLGLLVSPISLRHPALMAKMITTLDHISGGRAVLGVGAGWVEEEHRQYGFDFGSGFGERFDWLREAMPVIRGMLEGTRPSATGHYDIAEVVNSPQPVQERLPILIGGGGPKRTLRLVAEFADMCNLIGSPETIAEKESKLLEHCAAVGRNPDEIERTVAIRQPIIRDSRSEAAGVLEEICDFNQLGRWAAGTTGTADDLVDELAGYVELGYRHIIFQFLAPYDDETMERLALEVRPRLADVATS